MQYISNSINALILKYLLKTVNLQIIEKRNYESNPNNFIKIIRK